MRPLLAFLAILALMISPVTAAAAQVECANAGPEAMASMASMAMPMAQSADDAKVGHDPCCDENHKAPHDSKACAQICAALCATVAALPTSEILLPASEPMRLVAARANPLRTHAPPRDERPPKLIA
jgi:hypothetical protein